jgi:hypothetical protein
VAVVADRIAAVVSRILPGTKDEDGENDRLATDYTDEHGLYFCFIGAIRVIRG